MAVRTGDSAETWTGGLGPRMLRCRSENYLSLPANFTEAAQWQVWVAALARVYCLQVHLLTRHNIKGLDSMGGWAQLKVNPGQILKSMGQSDWTTRLRANCAATLRIRI